MSVTVGEILVAARAGLAALTSETVGYLVLGAADRACPAAPAAFDVNGIELDDRGIVTVPGIRPAAQDQTESQLRGILLELLEHANQSTPALLRVGRAHPRGAGRLIGEIEAALIPANRAAARRALARLYRDVARARTSGALSRIAAPTPEPVSLFDDAPVAEGLSPSAAVVALPPVEARAEIPRLEVPAPRAWASISPVDGAAVRRPEATPFLGTWPVAVIETPEHDTEHAPFVADSDPVTPAPIDWSDIAETTRVLFVAAPEMTQPLGAPIECTPVVEVECALAEAAPIIGPAWTPVVESTGTRVAVASVREPLSPLVPVADCRAILAPAYQKGFIGWILTPVDDELPSADTSDVLLDGAAMASVPLPTECEVLAEPAVDDGPPMVESASEGLTEFSESDGEASPALADIDVIYEEDEPPPATDVYEMAGSPGADELSPVSDDALLEWVVRDEDLYEEILGVQRADLAEADFEEIPAAQRADLGEMAYEEILGVQRVDLGEMEWMKPSETLAETPCEVPFAKFDPRESYAPKAMLHRWEPAPELDQEAIDAGWEILDESSPPFALVSPRLPSEPYSTGSPTPPPYRARQSDVSELLDGFAVAETRSLREMARELKLIAGVAVTPAPPGASPLAAGGGGVETSVPCTSRIWPSSRDS